MSFALLAPLGLAALVALALPLLIHLVRRIELRTTPFAALRWISERIRPRRRLRFERPWLLLLRLALLSLLALLLARPVINESTSMKPAWVVVAPGSALADARAAVSIANADWRWLAPGFPAIETPAPDEPVPAASLLRELDAELPQATKLAIVVPEELSGPDGERPALSHELQWHVVPGRMPDEKLASSRDARVLAVRYAPSSEPSIRYLRAAVVALAAQGDEYVLDAQAQQAALDGATRQLVWLGAELPPPIRRWIEAGGTAIVDHGAQRDGAPVWRDADGKVLARARLLGRGRLVSLANALAPETLPALLEPDFPRHLHDLLQGEPRAPTRAPARAMQPAHASSGTPGIVRPSAAKPLDPWLALLIAALVLAERMVATRSREPA